MAGVRKLNTCGSGIVYDSKSCNKARHFFDLNPGKPARSLLEIVELCSSYRYSLLPIEDGEYDENFYVRRSNNLNFFFKYLNILSGLDDDGRLADCVFDDDEAPTILKIQHN